MTLTEAISVLGAAQHRGAAWWSWDTNRLRVTPLGWNGLDCEPAPELTTFEALAIAGRLVEIGATGPRAGALP